jgi:hypothetical protein
MGFSLGSPFFSTFATKITTTGGVANRKKGGADGSAFFQFPAMGSRMVQSVTVL